jgi:16S rRNA (guanine(966)-N(2))-methyltransferase RsmD
LADAGRVIAGTARGTKLLAPGPTTRPLADRVKQTLFAILEPDLRDSTFLDLFAGSGAGGIEALSRGAARCVFVERDPTAVRTIEANLRLARLDGSALVVRGDVLDAIRAGGRAALAGPYEIVLLDPPYDQPLVLAETLQVVGPLVREGGRVVAKHFWRDRPPATVGLLASERERRFGETGLTFFRRSGAAGGEAGGAG